MSTAELTERIERLNIDDYNMVIALVNRLSNQQEQIDLPKYTEEEIVNQLSQSIEKSNLGETKSADDISKSMRLKYAV